MVGVAGPLRVARAGAAHEGPGRRDERPARRARRHRRGGADHRGRAAAVAHPDGARGQGPRRRPLPVGGVHLDERRARGVGEVRGVRARRPRVLRREDRLRRAPRRRRRCAPSASCRTSCPRCRSRSRRPRACSGSSRRHDDVLDPRGPRAAPACGHRDGDAGRRPARPRLGDRRRDRVPHGARRAAARPDPRGDQDRRVRRGVLHLVVDGAQPGRDRRQAARPHDRRLHRPADGRDRARVRPAGRRAAGGGAGARAGRRAGGARGAAPRGGRTAARRGRPRSAAADRTAARR